MAYQPDSSLLQGKDESRRQAESYSSSLDVYNIFNPPDFTGDPTFSAKGKSISRLESQRQTTFFE